MHTVFILSMTYWHNNTVNQSISPSVSTS